MKSVIDEVNDGQFKGSICEVGIGVPLQFEWLNRPGASKTIIFAHSPYSREMQPHIDYRSVSKEMAEALAWNDFDKISEVYNGKRFSVSIIGSHKDDPKDGETHGWISLVTSEEGLDTIPKCINLHFSMKNWHSRIYAGREYTKIAYWLLSKVILNKYKSWIDAFKNIPYGFGYQYLVDVIESEDISIEEHLHLCCQSNPMVYHNGQFRRAQDYIRKYSQIYRGSFNPITTAHEQIGKNALLELDINNARKGVITAKDASHRISMIDKCGLPVLINHNNPMFVHLWNKLKHMGMEKVEFIVGIDTFNAIVNDKYIPQPDFLEPLEKGNGVKFLVTDRDGYELVSNVHSKKIGHEMLILDYKTNSSATEVRNGDLSLVNEKVANYIKTNGLYGVADAS